jgi:predicted metal-dependent hydrolase
VEVAVRESSRVRRARVVVRGTGSVEVVVPQGTADRVVDGLIEAHGAWIVGNVARARERSASRPSLDLGRPGLIPLQGAWVPVVRVPGGRTIATLSEQGLVVHGDEQDAEAAILRWYRRVARERIGAAVEREAKRLAVAPGALSIRDQRSRWGSCSRRGDLSFSWRLVIAPLSVLDYVVVHELCHLVQPNHSAAFWRLVDDALPGWRDRAAWLRDHADELHSYRPV